LRKKRPLYTENLPERPDDRKTPDHALIELERQHDQGARPVVATAVDAFRGLAAWTTSSKCKSLAKKAVVAGLENCSC
jgi:hypothetical protein